MSTCLIPASKLFRIALILLLASILSAWTCSVIAGFNSCPSIVPVPQIVSLSPNTIPANAVSVLLTVTGIGFVPRSQILWNGNPLPTTFLDSRRLQSTITQQTFVSFGVSAGTSVLISVMSPGFTIAGCSDGGISGTLVLDLN
jgi:IPT/TIG domain